jgi:hypothetical protein
MNFAELVRELKKIPLDEWRKEDAGYLEFVVSGHHLAHLYPVLERYFGVPFKPPGVSPTAEHVRKTRGYGGIRKQQTLYYVERDGSDNCAMVWPWNDKSRVTVKIAQGTVGK